MDFSKLLSEKLLELDSPIYIAGHIKPDQDSICSCLALAKVLNKYQKEAYVLLDDKDRDVLSWISDHSLIKNKVMEDTYNFISLDLNEKKRLGSFQKYFDKAKYTINIDHHQDNKNEANINYSATSYSSTCEILYEIIDMLGKENFDLEINELLYSGIMNDTNCFSRRLSNKTFIIAQQLINSGIDYSKIIKRTLKERTMYEFKALARLVNDIKYDTFHYVILDKNEDCYKDLTHNQIVKKIAEDLRTIEGMDIFILLIKNNDEIVAKCMSNASENADKIASIFGGGGHKKEAGFTTKNISINEIITKIKNYIYQQNMKPKL